MAKEKLIGCLHEPLTAVLGTRAKVAALRVLWRAQSAIPFREVVRRTGMAYRSIDLALGDLLKAGLIEQLAGGRERRVHLRPGHRLAPSIAALMQAEADFFAALRIELRAVAEGMRSHGLLGAAIVGATARREEPLSGPIDIVVLVDEPAALPRCRGAFGLAGDALTPRFGATLHVLLYDLVSARAMWRTRTPAAERSVREAELLAGSPLALLLDR